MLSSLISANLLVLEQGSQLLRSVSAGAYAAPSPLVYQTSIGAHFRHVLDHYLLFLEAWEMGGLLDYEKRIRDVRIENDPAHANAVVRQISAGLDRLMQTGTDPSLHLRAENGCQGDQDLSTQTTAARELEFLLSHAVHHYALIGVICRQHGIVPPPDFGVAPSTLRFRQRTAAAAA